MIELLNELNKIDVMYQKQKKHNIDKLYNLYEICMKTNDSQYILSFCHEFFIFAVDASHILNKNCELQKLIALYNSGMDIHSGKMYFNLATQFLHF